MAQNQVGVQWPMLVLQRSPFLHLFRTWLHCCKHHEQGGQELREQQLRLPFLLGKLARLSEAVIPQRLAEIEPKPEAAWRSYGQNSSLLRVKEDREEGADLCVQSIGYSGSEQAVVRR